MRLRVKPAMTISTHLPVSIQVYWDNAEMPLTERYALFKKHIKNIHISDRSADGVEHKILGTGDLPIKEFVKTLKKDGYKYPLTIELDLDDKNRNNIETKEQAIEALNKSLEIIRLAQDN